MNTEDVLEEFRGAGALRQVEQGQGTLAGVEREDLAERQSALEVGVVGRGRQLRVAQVEHGEPRLGGGVLAGTRRFRGLICIGS